jgi:hypothetical protein
MPIGLAENELGQSGSGVAGGVLECGLAIHRRGDQRESFVNALAHQGIEQLLLAGKATRQRGRNGMICWAFTRQARERGERKLDSFPGASRDAGPRK